MIMSRRKHETCISISRLVIINLQAVGSIPCPLLLHSTWILFLIQGWFIISPCDEGNSRWQHWTSPPPPPLPFPVPFCSVPFCHEHYPIQLHSKPPRNEGFRPNHGCHVNGLSVDALLKSDINCCYPPDTYPLGIIPRIETPRHFLDSRRPYN